MRVIEDGKTFLKNLLRENSDVTMVHDGKSYDDATLRKIVGFETQQKGATTKMTKPEISGLTASVQMLDFAVSRSLAKAEVLKLERDVETLEKLEAEAGPETDVAAIRGKRNRLNLQAAFRRALSPENGQPIA